MVPSATRASVHRVIVPGAAGLASLVLLHGSGGNETSLLDFAARLAPGAPRIALRGDRPHGEGFAFFHRFADRSLDLTDLAAAARDLCALVDELDERPRPILLGMSNGAIAVAAMLALGGARTCSAAVLLRPLPPFPGRDFPELEGLPVLILDAREDERREPSDAPHLTTQLVHAGALVTRIEVPGGHLPGPLDQSLAAAWLTSLQADRQV